MIKNQTGELITNEKEVAEEFKVYFDKLLNNTATRINEHTNIPAHPRDRKSTRRLINQRIISRQEKTIL